MKSERVQNNELMRIKDKKECFPGWEIDIRGAEDGAARDGRPCRGGKSMSAKRYFQLSYVWPVVLPVAVLVLPGGVVANWVQQLCREFLYSGGAPYALFAGAMLLWSSSKEGGSVRRSIYLAPVLFLPALGMSVVIAAHRETYQPNPGQLALAVVLYGMILAIPVLILGYCYVGLVNLGFVILRSLGAFSHEEMTALAGLETAGEYAGKASLSVPVRPEARADWSCGPVAEAVKARGVAYPGGATDFSGGVSYASGKLHPDGSPYGFAGWEDEKMKGASRSCKEVASESRVAIDTATTASPVETGSSCTPARPAETGRSSAPASPGGTGSYTPARSAEAVSSRAPVNPASTGWASPRNDWKAQKKRRVIKPLVARDPLTTAALGLLAPLILLSAFAIWRHIGVSRHHPVVIHQVQDGTTNGAGTGRR